MNLTPEQRSGIEILDRSLLVSAGAGSGKTAVLAQRCAHIVCRSHELGREPCGVENLLVVTFTNAAAQQMRDRIARTLAEELEKAKDDSSKEARLRREIALLPRASISTLSSFCANLVRRHFHAAGVDPSFVVLDEDQSRLLKQRAARAVLEEQYAQGDQAFLELIDLYAEGYDERLIGALIGCHNLQTSLVDPAKWRRESVARIEEAAEKPLKQSALGAQMLSLLKGEMAALVDDARSIRRDAEHFGLHAYAEHINKFMIDPAMHWEQLAGAQDLKGLADAFSSYDRGRLPNSPGSEGKENVQRAVRTWKALVSEGAASILLKFSEADWMESMRRVISTTAVFLRLSEQFEMEYTAAKQGMRALDFADLERSALRLLLAEPERPLDSGPSEIALHYQREFHHVLVDEFQDINQVQDALLRLLSRESASEETGASRESNLFAVGDVKQSIYRFRLAEPAMFKDRADRAKAGAASNTLKRIDLQMNFRSRAPLLGAVNAVFSRLLTDEPLLEIDYSDAHELHPNPDYGAAPDSGFPGAPVEIHVLEPPGTGDQQEEVTDDEGNGELPARESAEDVREAERIEREATLIGERIRCFITNRRMVIGEAGQPEPLSYRHVAVLLRSRKYNSELFSSVLRKMGVPCFSEVGTGFFASLEIRDVVSLLRLLDNRRQDIPLASVLRSPLVDLPDAEGSLATIRLAYSRKHVPFFQAVSRYAREKDDAIAARLNYVLEQLQRWRALAHRRPIAELLWKIYEDSGYLAYVAGLHDGEQRTANLLELHRRAGQFDSFARQGLGAFIEFLKSLDAAGEVGQPPVLSEAEDVVRVMSIHAAKGLEFPVVFLADCGKQHNLSDCRDSILLDRRLGVAMQAVDPERQVRYPSLVHELAKRDIRRATVAEELRVLYVAMTRAKEHLVCVGTVKRNAETDLSRWRRGASDEPIPPAEVLNGRSYLEWLGRTAAGTTDLFDIQVVRAQQIDAEASKYAGRSLPPQAPNFLAELRPLDPPPVLDQGMTEVIARLTATYRYAGVSGLRASAGVTSLDAAVDEAGNIGSLAAARLNPWQIAATDLRPPAFLDGTKAPSAAEIGTATHVALRLIDFRDTASHSAVRRQIEQMVARRQLDRRLADHIDIESIAWLASTDLGRLLAENHDVLLRELPVRVPVQPQLVEAGWEGEIEGPLDRVLLRGQIDVVVPLKTGLILADYKTDRFEGIEALPGPVEPQGAVMEVTMAGDRYRRQIGHYCRALQQLTGQTVTAAYLVLLSARKLSLLDASISGPPRPFA